MEIGRSVMGDGRRPLYFFRMHATAHDIVNDTFPEAQAQIRRRLDEIWATTRSRDFERLESFHLYGPKFTEFKEGKARGDARSCAAGERAFFAMIDEPRVDMKDLAVNVFGGVAIATFNGHFTGQIKGNPVAVDQQATMVFVDAGGDWKIVHEHFSLIGPPPMPRP
jgi:ketosteroid isomerase-like protein